MASPCDVARFVAHCFGIVMQAIGGGAGYRATWSMWPPASHLLTEDGAEKLLRLEE